MENQKTRFTINADDTVTDTKTGLTWSRKTLAEYVTHDAAKKVVEALGDGWRLPTVQELFTLADHSREEPAIDVEAFPDTVCGGYWTDTPTCWNDAAVWVVYFGGGFVDGDYRHDYACVRAVRALPAGQ